MSRRKPRYEVARTASGLTVRFIAANGTQVWTTSKQTYSNRSAAFRAIELVTGWPVRAYLDTFEVRVAVTVDPDGLLEVREVDERGQA